MTVFSVEQNKTIETDLSIEYSQDDNTFEIYLNRNPAINDASLIGDDGSSDDSEQKSVAAAGSSESPTSSNKPQIKQVTQHIDSKDLVVFELVKDQKWARVYGMVENNPSLAKMPFLASSPVFDADCQDNLLLHHVCKNKAPMEIVECVLNAYPMAAAIAGNNGFYPLHFACQSGVPVNGLLKLLKTYPSAIQLRDDRKGRLPLHWAARRGAGGDCTEALTLLSSYFPEAIVIVDDNDMTPVDYAVRIKSPKVRIECLAVLEMGHRWIQVAQNVAARLESNFDDRREHLEKNFENFIDSMHSAHEHEVGRITEKYLSSTSLLDMEARDLDVESRDERMANLDAVFQENLVNISRRQDRFKRLEESAQQEIADLKRGHEFEIAIMADDLEESKRTERNLRSKVNEKDQKIAELERLLQKQEARRQAAMAVRTASLERSEASRIETEKKLEDMTKRCALFEKDLELRENLLRRVTQMAQTKEQTAQKKTIELVRIIQDQEKQMNILIGKLDFFSDQIGVLKGRLGET